MQASDWDKTRMSAEETFIDVGQDVHVNATHSSVVPNLLDYGFHPPLMGTDVWLTPDQAAWSICIPLIGRIRIVKDPIGISLALFILFYWVYNVGCVYFIILLPRYNEGHVSLTLLILLGVIATLCIISFFKASTTNPGALSLSSSLSTPGSDWNICQKCKQSRPPRTHHCRRCGQCVRRMDHHCPWINNCVGEDNQHLFMLLVLYAHLLSVVCLILDVLVLYGYMPCEGCEEVFVFGVGERKLLWTSAVMGVFMTCAGFGLFMTQHFSVIFEVPSMVFNRMQMEFVMSGRMPAIWPLKMKNAVPAYRSVCGPGNMLCWVLPFRKRSSQVFHGRENLV